MTKISVQALCITLLLGLVVGCSYVPRPTFLQHRDTDYLSAKSAKPLVIPPGVSSEAIHSEYPVSEHAYEGQPKEVSIVPPGIKS